MLLCLASILKYYFNQKTGTTIVETNTYFQMCSIVEVACDCDASFDHYIYSISL